MTSSSISGRNRRVYVISSILFFSEVHQGIEVLPGWIYVLPIFDPTQSCGSVGLEWPILQKICYPTGPRLEESFPVYLVFQFAEYRSRAYLYSFPEPVLVIPFLSSFILITQRLTSGGKHLRKTAELIRHQVEPLLLEIFASFHVGYCCSEGLACWSPRRSAYSFGENCYKE